MIFTFTSVRVVDNPEQSFFSDGSNITEIKAELDNPTDEDRVLNDEEYNKDNCILPTMDIRLIGWDQMGDKLASEIQIGDHLITSGFIALNFDLKEKYIHGFTNDTIDFTVEEFHLVHREVNIFDTNPNWTCLFEEKVSTSNRE